MKVTSDGTQKEAQIVELTSTKKSNILHYDIDYDTTKPEETIRDFVKDIKGMVSRYEGNKLRIIEIEAELLDIYHYIEISTYKKVPDGYKLYRKMAELRRERRACKNENDLLQPIYEYFHATEVLNKLSYVQGECAKAKNSIDNRTYLVRTDILDEWLEPDMPIEEIFDEEGLKIPDPTTEDNNGVIPLDPVPISKDTKNKPMSAFKQVWKA